MRFLGPFVALAVASAPVTAMAAEELPIYRLQGAGHGSPHAGEFVRTTGIVTFLAGNNFYLQGEDDGDAGTSNAILVRATRSLGVKPGDEVTVEGEVEESGSRYPYLSTTVVSDTVLLRKVEGSGIPVPLVIGNGGLLPPTEVAMQTDGPYDPASVGADFYEALEGMLVSIRNPSVVGPTSGDDRGTFQVVAEGGAGATGMNSLGGISITPGDANPERIKVQLSERDTEALQVTVGDTFDLLTGVVTYDGNGAYGIILRDYSGYSGVPAVPAPVTPATPVQLDIASYNVENLDPKDEDPTKVYDRGEIDDDVGDGKFSGIAAHIVSVLRSPAIIALQEVQDNDGAEYSDVTAGDLTLAELAGAITEAGGPAYLALELPPPDDLVGGQPGGNIHAAYLFDPARVSPMTDEMTLIQSAAFEGSRLPLAVPYMFGDHRVWVVNVHFSSKGGSDPTYGTVQPPRDPSALRRIAQARAVREFIRTLPPDERMVVVGDFNSYWFEDPLLLLTGGQPPLRNLAMADPPEERISYVFDGNSQSLDHVLVRLGLGDSAVLSTPHVNSTSPVKARMSDHDPKHVVITFGD
jgi:predicted extracellular nuclease